MFRIEFHPKKSASAYVYSPPSLELGARKIDMDEKLYCIEMVKYIHLRAQHCQKYTSPGKKA